MVNSSDHIVTLYGHLIVDKILINFDEHLSLGGITNVWYGLRTLSQALTINIRPTDIGEAIIKVDKQTNQRIGRGCLNIKSNNVTHLKSDWHHIAYINQITHTEFISKIDEGIISADITKESPEKVIPLLKYIDYLFISEDDLFMDLSELAGKTKGWVIVHSPTKSMCTDGNEMIVYDIPPNLLLSNVNVLGAGDYFAAGFIECCLRGDTNKDAIISAHTSTTNILKEQI